MRILMVTNTYTPHVGGVANSILQFERAFRERGHRVLVIAPEYDGAPKREENVLRLPSIRNVNKSDFSFTLAIPEMVGEDVARFNPDIVHSHHPYLLGMGALRIAAARNIPAVFTHHTLYEHYTHYVAGDSEAMKRFVISLSTGYANLCDHVIAPSKSVRGMIRKRGVKGPISVIPTGVDVRRFRKGDGGSARRRLDIPKNALVVGHVGRLAREKNLAFLAQAAAEFLRGREDAYFLAVGHGPMADEIRGEFERQGLADRLRMPGSLLDERLVDAYHAMDVFAFTSRTETQGMVLAEAMAAGLPAVALKAPAVAEIVRDGFNGRLVADERAEDFAAALRWATELKGAERRRVLSNALSTANTVSEARCAARELRLYRRIIRGKRRDVARTNADNGGWGQFVRSMEEEWKMWGVSLSAIAEAALGHHAPAPKDAPRHLNN